MLRLAQTYALSTALVPHNLRPSLKLATTSFMFPSSSKPVSESQSYLLGVYSRIFAKRASPIQGS